MNKVNSASTIMPKGKSKSALTKLREPKSVKSAQIPPDFFVPKSPFLKRSGSPHAFAEYLSEEDSDDTDMTQTNALYIAKALEQGLKPVLDSLASLHSKFDSLENRVVTLERKMQESDGRVDVLRKEQTMAGQAVHNIQERLKELAEGGDLRGEWRAESARSITELRKVTEDLENVKRAAGLRLLGFCSNAQDDALRIEVEDFVTRLMALDQGTTRHREAKVVKAYRLPSKAQQGAKSRVGTVMVILQDQWMREIILSVANRQKEVKHADQRVLIFPDLSYMTVLRRKELGMIRKQLIGKGLKTSVHYPSKLKVQKEGKMYVFVDPEQARTFLEGLP